MSYSVEWIPIIDDRTYGDVQILETDSTNPNTKGSYNYFDLNRIENNTQYCKEYMLDHKIIRVPPSMAIKTNWTENDIPTRDDMIRIIRNVMILMNVSNPIIQEKFTELHEATQLTYQVANAIEHNLDLMHNQPDLPIKKWLLKLEHGIIQEYGTSMEYIAEDEIVHIEAKPYGESAQYMIFTNWSGNTDDLQYVEDPSAQVTTFQMVYHDLDSYEVELTANFMTRFPRTLTLHGGTIYDDIGGTSRAFYAGDDILILANEAAPGKAFYEWQGTKEGLENLTGGSEPSTSWLTMPDCDVELTSFYINAGQHKVTVDGNIQGWYEYKDRVYLSYNSRGPKWTFAYWSGDTAYLEDVTSSSLVMPDVNISFTSHWNYVYSYNTVTMIKGTIDGQNKIEEAKEQSGHQIIAPAAPEGYTFGRWTLEGLGSFANAESSTTTFYIGDGNAVIDCIFVPLHTVTVENEKNNGEIRTIRVGEGKKYTIDADEVLADYMFDYWAKDGAKWSTSDWVRDIVMGTEDVTYHAYYRPRNSYTLTVNNGSGSGTYKERQSVSISANAAPEGYRWDRWSGNWYSIGWKYDANTSIVMPSGNCTVNANYTPIDTRPSHTLTVNNGSGSGTYKEGTTVRCYGNQAPSSYEFAYWTEGDSIISYSNPISITIGTGNRTITANYKPIPYFTLTVINGKGSGTYIRNSSPQIIMDPAPEGMQFLQWEVLVGDDNDVSQPLAENTTIRNLTHDVTVQATYYVPREDITYTLTVTGKDGTPNYATGNYPIGKQVNITADSPDKGWKFLKWDGDTQYVNDPYAEKAIVNMPGRNIQLRMLYVEEGSTPTFHVLLEGGKIQIDEDRWNIEGEFEEGTTLNIKADEPLLGWEFVRWQKPENAAETDKSEETVANLTEPETTLQVRDFKITLSVLWKEKLKYIMTVNNGFGSGSYYPNQPVQIYFNLQNTETTHYKFTRWSGSDIAYLKLTDGRSFDIFKAEEQAVAMPNRNITITALCDISYLLTIQSVEQGFYLAGEKIQISAEEIEGKVFRYWSGDTSCVDNIYNPNIVVTMPSGSVNLIPIYSNINERNGIGYVLTDLYDTDIIMAEDITVISGEIETGFIITDNLGHIYVVTTIVNDQVNIIRLTTKDTGPEDITDKQEVEGNG